SAGTGPINGPEVVSGVLELDGREEFFDLDSLQDLIGVRIRRTKRRNRYGKTADGPLSPVRPDTELCRFKNCRFKNC
ncbi:hypothetical protein, partial [Deinococcus saxicola]|uniref:hypothetical protein n=1 Tax=Deinococcus saxicola TaxID=249406 RepID=UPI0039EF7FC4